MKFHFDKILVIADSAGGKQIFDATKGELEKV